MMRNTTRFGLITAAALASALVLAALGASSAFSRGTGCVTSNIGTSGDDVLCGTSAGQTMSGGDGDDEIFGLGGNDVLGGGNGVDFLDGGTGNDILIGGPGLSDQFIGHSGNDQLRARDGFVDALGPSQCGSGTDSLDMDLLEAAAIGFPLLGIPLLFLNCEKITVGAVNEGPNVVISRRTPKIKDNGKVPVRLRCPAELTAPCAGTLTLGRSLNKPGSPKAYSIDPGAKDKVSARLSRRDRRKLSRSGEITVGSTSVEQGEFGDKTTVQTLELRRKRQT